MTPLLPCLLAILGPPLVLPTPQGEVVVSSPISETYIAAVRDGARGDLASARRELGTVLRTDPQNTSARLRLEVLDAVDNQTIDKRTAARVFQAVLYTISNRRHDALALLDTVVATAPDFAEAYRLRGRTRSDDGDLSLAIVDYTEAIRRLPTFSEAYLNRANAHARLRDFPLAIQDYGKAIELAPSNAAAYTSRGITLYRQGRPDDALRDFDRAIQLQPGLGPAYLNKALLYEGLGRLAEAAATYEALLQHSNLADSASLAEARRRLANLQRR